MQRKILRIFFALIFLLFSSIFFSPSVNASFPCSITPANVSTSTNPVNFTIDSNGNLAGGKYYVSIGSAKVGANRARIGTLFDASGGKISLSVARNYDPGTWQVGVYSQSDSGTNLCQNTAFVVASSATGGNTCSLSFQNKSFTPSDYISAKISGSLATTGNADDLVRLFVRTPNNNGNTIWNGCVKRGLLGNGFGLGYFSTGQYFVQVNDRCQSSAIFFWDAENQACYSTFFVDPNGGGVGQAGSPDNPAPNTPCLTHDKNGNCATVATAIGDIGTNPISLVTSIFGLILGLSGGIAIVLIMMSGYRILASQGNPEGLKGAREQLTAAIVGLLFIIFSLVILQIIGVNILHIPGFSGSAPIERRGGP